VTALGWRTSGFRLQRRAFDVRHWQELVRGGLPFLGLDVALHIRNQIDVILVGALLSEQAAGWLAAAYRIVSVPTFIPHLIVTPLLPALSRHAERRALFRQTLRHSLAVVIILTVAADAMIIALAPAVPEVLGWGPAFRHAVPLMVIIAITAPLGAAGTVLGTALLALRRERRWLRVTIAGALFNPTMNLVLIPLAARWLDNGAIGAAVAEVGTELVMLGGALFLMPPGMIDRAMAWMGLRVVVAGAGLAVVARVVQPVSLPLAAAAGGTAFLLAAWALRVLRPTDLRTLRDVARESLARRRMIGQDA
jgi:O-antigen/teichoic acid export membrane protein